MVPTQAEALVRGGLERELVLQWGPFFFRVCDVRQDNGRHLSLMIELGAGSLAQLVRFDNQRKAVPKCPMIEETCFAGVCSQCK